ncbi:MAG TPA: radical SAM protein [Thermoanaerobaculia bacterium]|jgi:radical SAM PhpK family P-methyltransferase|nr:radical SAM protein [Thermoanaerobaculia bacterium]
MAGQDRLDCIVVGHNDLDFSLVEQALIKTRHNSAAYVDLQANSVSYRGRRMTYMSLLNEVLKDAHGKDYGLHECQLPHLGTAYLTSFLRRRGFAVEMINFFNESLGFFQDLLESAAPRAVAITTTLYVEHSPIQEIVAFVRRHSPETRIIVGGPHVLNLCATHQEEALDFILEAIGADLYIHDSQGELTLARVLEQLRRGGDLAAVPNLIYVADPADQAFRRTPRAPENNDMNAEAVDWRQFDSGFITPTVQMRTARSCAFSCSFCRYPVNAGALTLTGLEVLEGDLRYLQSIGVRNLVFIDDTFNVPLPRFKKICRLLIELGASFDWYSFFRASNSDDEAIDLMAESGCKGVFLGIESGDPTILEYMAKHATVEKYLHAIRRFNQVGITSFASIIVGFPGETDETFQNTCEFLTAANPTFYRGEIYYHYTNVPIHQRAEELGLHGAGYSWRHRGMDWSRAAELVQQIYRTLPGPRVLPGYMFDFWALPYLTGKGFSIDQVRAFTDVAQGMVVRGFDQARPDHGADEERLRAIFRSPGQEAGALHG